jgi:acyl-CoA synthetase (NDP forming)
MARAALDALLRPRSIAVIGASRTPGKNGHSVVRNLVRGGYPGRVFPINPAGGEIEGVRSYRSLAELPEPAECAMLVIPAAHTVEALRQCAEAGIRAAVVGASAFAEAGTQDGIARQEALAEIARAHGMALLGPNTNGFLNAADRVSLGFNAEHAEHFPLGVVSVVSHSGALFGGFARTLRRLGGGLSKFIPVGNEAGIGMLDVLEYLIDDPSTEVIGLVVEALASGPRLRALAARAREAGKPIVALKLGRSAVGTESTMAHSSRLAGRARAYDALFAACGIATVRSVEALAGGCALLAGRSARSVAGDQHLVCVSSSGAGGSLLADFAAERHLPLAGDRVGEWEGEARAPIAALAVRGRLRNPIDTGSLGGGWSQIGDIYQILERNGITGPSAVYAHNAPTPAMDRALATSIIERKRRTETPIVLMAPGALDPALEADYIAAGILVFHDLPTGFDSLRCHYATLPNASSLSSHQGKSRGEGEWREINRILHEAGERGRVLSELASADVLRRAGVQMVESRSFATIAEGEDIAGRLGYPIVLKSLAPGVAHKSAQGLVAVGIADADTLRQRFHAMEKALGAQRAEATFILQPMLRGDAELLIGVSREPALGHFLVAGWGGVHAEALDQVNLLPIPSSPEAVRAFVAAAPFARVLARCNAAAPVAVALEALQALVLHAGDGIESIDVNPFLVSADGGTAVDALIVLRQ